MNEADDSHAARLDAVDQPIAANNKLAQVGVLELGNHRTSFREL
jgi:hypothetical protein